MIHSMADDLPAYQPTQLRTRSRGSSDGNVRGEPLHYHLALNRFVVSNHVSFLLDHHLPARLPYLRRESNLAEKSVFEILIVWANECSEALLLDGLLCSSIQMSILITII